MQPTIVCFEMQLCIWKKKKLKEKKLQPEVMRKQNKACRGVNTDSKMLQFVVVSIHIKV